MKGYLTITLALMLLLTSCWSNKIAEGVVFHKEFKRAEKGYKTSTNTRTRVRNGNTVSVTNTTTKRVAYPDRWVVYIHSKDLKDTADYYLHKEVYDSLKIGDWFVFDTIKGTAYEPFTIIK